MEHRLLQLVGHYTPMVMGDALVINDDGQMLLIQRADEAMYLAKQRGRGGFAFYSEVLD